MPVGIVVCNLAFVLLLDLQLISVISLAPLLFVLGVAALIAVNDHFGQFIYWLIDKHYVGYALFCPPLAVEPMC